MPPEACRDWRGALGAAALGRLDAADEIALQAHLDGCPACRAELREIDAVAAVLPHADVERVLEEGRPPAELGPRVFASVADARSETRRRRAAVIAVAAAIVIILGAAAAVTLTSGEDSTRDVALSGAHAGGWVEMTEIDAGTEMRLHASGLGDGDWYWLWITGADGDRVAAGTFQGTSADLDLTMTAGLPLDDARRVWVTDSDDRIVLDAEF